MEMSGLRRAQGGVWGRLQQLQRIPRCSPKAVQASHPDPLVTETQGARPHTSSPSRWRSGVLWALPISFLPLGAAHVLQGALSGSPSSASAPSLQKSHPNSWRGTPKNPPWLGDLPAGRGCHLLRPRNGTGTCGHLPPSPALPRPQSRFPAHERAQGAGQELKPRPQLRSYPARVAGSRTTFAPASVTLAYPRF